MRDYNIHLKSQQMLHPADIEVNLQSNSTRMLHKYISVNLILPSLLVSLLILTIIFSDKYNSSDSNNNKNVVCKY